LRAGTPHAILAHAMPREHTVDQIIGANVGDLRRRLGLTQEDLRQAMDSLGFEWRFRQTVAQVEEGSRRLSWDEFFALAAYFEMPPTALLIKPGAQTSYSHVRIAGRAVTNEDWAAWWAWGPSEKAPKSVLRAIDHLLYGRVAKGRWSKLLRKGEGLSAAYSHARDYILSSRKRLPGPTFISDERMEVKEGFAPFGEITFTLVAGEPYVARDDAEAAVLRRKEQDGKVRRIERHKARIERRRIQQGKKGK
jgi:transcriptional regulator with XRE-family HTH domain